MTIAPMTSAHAVAVLAIYTAGIATGNATYETAAPDWARFDAEKLPEHRFVAIDHGEVAGWIACSPVSAGAAYSGVVDHSIYVDPAHTGRGIGRTLLETVIASTEAAGIWTIQAGVFPENSASQTLHRRCGFRQIGIRERIVRHHGIWRDVVLFERRSPIIT
jgi:L-amino acid N-acyltransferase YncA